MCHIQTSKVVVAVYLQGSTKAFNEEHWTEHLNLLPRLHNLDVKVQIRNIDDPSGEIPKFGSKNKYFAAHILCAEQNKAEVNLALGNTYGKERTASRAAGNLPEGRAMKYVPYNSTGVKKSSPKAFCQLQKTRILHSWNQKNHHYISMWGFDNVYRVLVAPNNHKFTICQVIMSTKWSFDFIAPLFIGVDVTPEGDVVVICSRDMKVEVESLLSHFGLYAAHIFGSVVWEAFTVEYKLKMNCYQYCPIKNCVVEIDNSSIYLDESVDREFAKCEFTDDVLVIPDEVHLDLPHQFTLHLCPDINDILGDENGDSTTFKSNLSAATLASSKTAPSDPIHYQVPCPKPLTISSSSVENETPTFIMSNQADKTDQADKADTSMTLPTTAATSQVDPPVPPPPKGEALSNRSEETGDD